MQTKTIIIATRNSDLALWQANLVKQQLQAKHPENTYQLLPITTKADKNQLPIHQQGGKGVFVKAIQAAVLSGKAHLAVHSAKDLACTTPQKLELAGTLTRANPADALLANCKLLELPSQATIGTGSPRRAMQLLSLRPDLNIQPIRGNVASRIQQWQSKKYQGIILAVAGLTRLQLTSQIQEILSTETIIPAAGQGIIAIECLKTDINTKNLINTINDKNSYLCLATERECIKHLGGHCFAPIGAFATIEQNNITLRAIVAGKQSLVFSATNTLNNYLQLGKLVADKLNQQGAQAIIQTGHLWDQ